jgi:hypothetical protein
MCLRTISSTAEKVKILKDIPVTGLKVYKVVSDKDSAYFPLFSNLDTPYKIGVNEADTKEQIIISYGNWQDDVKNLRYKAGFHSYITMEAAKNKAAQLRNPKDTKKLKIILGIIDKSWITTIGTEAIADSKTNQIIEEIVIVSEKMKI